MTRDLSAIKVSTVKVIHKFKNCKYIIHMVFMFLLFFCVLFVDLICISTKFYLICVLICCLFPYYVIISLFLLLFTAFLFIHFQLLCINFLSILFMSINIFILNLSSAPIHKSNSISSSDTSLL